MKSRPIPRSARPLALGLVILVGCTSGDQPPLATVSGKVTLNGEPLPNVEIAFEPEKGRPSYGLTDATGKYDLVYIRDTRGAKVGKHKITVKSSQVDNSKVAPVEVKPGSNVIDIECEPATNDKTPAKVDEP